MTGLRPKPSAGGPDSGDDNNAASEVMLVMSDLSPVDNECDKSVGRIETRVADMTPVLRTISNEMDRN